MQTTALIDAIVRQTMVLVAHLATISGTRAPLTTVVDQVFFELVGELRRRGLSPKVIADMFGIAVRTYHSRVRRLADLPHAARRSLWQDIFAYIRAEGPVSRAQIVDARAFRGVDDVMLGSILHDLVETGLVFQSGRGHRQVYGVLPPNQLAAVVSRHDALDALVRVAVFHLSPVTAEALATYLGLDAERVEAVLAGLAADGRIERVAGSPARYLCERHLIPVDCGEARDAAIFDHFRAVIHAICQRVDPESPDDTSESGGSTFTFDIWPGHPDEADVSNLLHRVRERAAELRRRVDDASSLTASPSPTGRRRIVFYCGQTTRGEGGAI